MIRRERRLEAWQPELGSEAAVDFAFSPEADAENQLAMMFAICDDALSSETHVTLILRFLYDALLTISPSPVVALNRGLALAELCGLDAGREALALLEGEPKLAQYSFYWAALADLERLRELAH